MADKEVEAMSAISKCMDGLDEDACVRILRWAVSRYASKGIRLPSSQGHDDASDPAGEGGDSQEGSIKVGKVAAGWLKRAGVAVSKLDSIFHVDGDSIEFIAESIPGASSKEQTKNAYLLTGAMQLILTDKPSFNDDAARLLCQDNDCLSQGNHAAYVKAAKGIFTGTKSTGYVLTTPGKKAAGELLKTMLEDDS